MTAKKPSKKPAPAPPKATSDGSQVIGPGVVKRPKREPTSGDTPAPGDLPYTPSAQVFRRRG